MPSNSPTSLGLIPDGNRRWARRHSVSLTEAYEAVGHTFRRFTDTLFSNGILTLSVYALSENNLQRDPRELAETVCAHIHLMRDVLPALADEWDASIHHVGDKLILPESYNAALLNLIALRPTATRRIYIYAGYSVRWDSETSLAYPLLPSDRPLDMDLVIRTGGNKRLSGFAPAQVHYAELFFLDMLFPDITPADIDAVMDEYARRQRRFGR